MVICSPDRLTIILPPAACELLKLNLWPEEESLAPVVTAVEAASDRITSLRWTLAKAWGHYHLQQVGGPAGQGRVGWGCHTDVSGG